MPISINVSFSNYEYDLESEKIHLRRQTEKLCFFPVRGGKPKRAFPLNLPQKFCFKQRYIYRILISLLIILEIKGLQQFYLRNTENNNISIHSARSAAATAKSDIHWSPEGDRFSAAVIISAVLSFFNIIYPRSASASSAFFMAAAIDSFAGGFFTTEKAPKSCALQLPWSVYQR